MNMLISYTTVGKKKMDMGKIEKKRRKLKDRIDEMEKEMILSLTKKSSKVEIDVPTYTRRINEMKKTLKELK